MPRVNHHISGNIATWAKALGIHRDALTRRLNRSDVKFGAGDLIPARDVYKALSGDKDAAMVRKLQAEAEAQERDNRKEDGELLESAAIEKKLWQDLLQPLRTEIEQMPKTYAAMANPQDPETARKVLEQWVEKTKQGLKERK